MQQFIHTSHATSDMERVPNSPRLMAFQTQYEAMTYGLHSFCNEGLRIGAGAGA